MALGHLPELPRTAGRPRGPSHPIASLPGVLVVPAGPRSLARVARDIWCTPRSLRARRKSSGTAGQPRGPSYPRPSHPVELIDPTDSRTLARVAREIWSTPRALGPEREFPGGAGRHCGPSHLSASPPGALVDTAVPRTRARVFLDSWSIPCELGPVPASPGPAGRRRGHWNPGLGRPGLLVQPAGYHSRTRVVQESWSTPWALGPGPESPGRAGRNTRALGHWPKMLRTAGRPPGASEAGVSRAGQVVDSVGKKNRTRVTREFLSNGGPSDPSASCPGNLATPRHSAQARVTWGNWSTPWAHGPTRESPGRACRPRGPSDRGPSRPGELVNRAGTGARPQVGRDIWSSLQALRHGPESPRRAGRQCGPSTGARVAWECW